jgi:UDP-N-acetyl-D-galactosamine dehydrogenase
LGRVGVTVQVHDPVASADETAHEYGITLTPLDKLRQADAVILAVAHKEYATGGWPFITRLLKNGQGTVLDIKSKLDRLQKPKGIDLWRL